MNGLELREVAQSCFPTLRQLVLILRAVSRTPCLLCKPQFLRLQHSDSYSSPGMSKHTAQHVPHMQFLYQISVVLPKRAFGFRRFETSWTFQDETLSRKRWEASIQERKFIPSSTDISSTQLRRPKN